MRFCLVVDFTSSANLIHKGRKQKRAVVNGQLFSALYFIVQHFCRISQLLLMLGLVRKSLYFFTSIQMNQNQIDYTVYMPSTAQSALLHHLYRHLIVQRYGQSDILVYFDV